MANALFAAYRTSVLTTPNSLSAATPRGMFIDHADDTPVAATDDFINDIASAARIPAIASCPAITSNRTYGSVAAGVFDADNITFTALTGDQAESFIIFNDTGNEATSTLFAFWDSATGLPLTPNGGDVSVAFNASGIWTF